MHLNSIQSTFEELRVEDNPKEVVEQFYDFITNIPFIQNLISGERKRACDLPRDADGKIEVSITNPHILEDMDYFRPAAIHFQKHGCYTQLRPNPNPNSEYGKWIREEIRRSWYGYVRPSDGEWIPGDYYYYLNYCPIQLIKKLPNGQSIRTIDFPRVWDGQYLVQHYLYNARLHGHHASELASRGKGKALPLITMVPTPEGYKFWNDVTIGDKLWGPNGDIVTVTGIPYEGPIEMLKVELADGREIYCSREHEFTIWYRGTKKTVEAEWIGYNYHKPRKVGPKNPIGDEYVISIPIADKVEYPYQEISIEPYTLGLILGDGCLRIPNYKHLVRFTGIKEDVEFYKTQIPYTISTYSSKDVEHSIHKENIIQNMMDMQLYMTNSHTKFIPNEYKYNTSEIRVAVLQGLIDTDGWINGSTFCYCTCSERLKDDVLEIARSLGIKAYSFKKKEAWTISLQTTEYTLCRLPRKINKIKPYSSKYATSCKRVTVTKVSYVTNTYGKCVSVDREDGLYLANDYIVTHNSYMGAGLLAKRFKLGESEDVRKKVLSAVTASDRKYIWGPNQILNMFKYYIDFQSQHTQFPRQLLTDSAQALMWESGFKDKETGVRKGTQNAVVGVTTGVNQDKLNGSRGVLYLIEEAGIFSNLNNLYQMIRPSVEDGKDVYGLIFLYGTAGDDMSDFTSLQEIMYNPDGYNMEKNENVWDKEGQGRKYFTFFYPAYLNRANCMDEEGNSNVTKALLEICQDRYQVKYNSSDINAITKRISQYPITPQEAIIRAHATIFPITELNERLNQIDNNPNFYDQTYVGDLVFNSNGEVEFSPSSAKPIRDFPTKDNKVTGAIEIFDLPVKNSEGKIPTGRYIAGADPYDDDVSNTMSLGTVFVMDTWTDTIVAEYTGRPTFANDYYEICRKLCLFYKASLMYENNKKGLFGYFSMMNCVYLLADTPEYLKAKQLIKETGYGNKAKGIGISGGGTLKGYGYERIQSWLMTPFTTIEKDSEGKEFEVTLPNLYRLKNRALIKELILWNPNINVDRIMALVQLILYREEKMILYNGDMSSSGQESGSDLANDPFFTQNYDERFLQ